MNDYSYESYSYSPDPSPWTPDVPEDDPTIVVDQYFYLYFIFLVGVGSAMLMYLWYRFKSSSEERSCISAECCSEFTRGCCCTFLRWVKETAVSCPKTVGSITTRDDQSQILVQHES